MGKLPLFLLLVSVFLTSTLATRYVNPTDPKWEKRRCMQRCERSHPGGEEMRDCRQRCQQERFGMIKEKMSRDDDDKSSDDDDDDDSDDGLVVLTLNAWHEKAGRWFEACLRQCRGQGHKCEKRCEKQFKSEKELHVNEGRECEVVCEKQGSEPWKCQSKCRKLDDDTNNQGRECAVVCEKQGTEPWKCESKCRELDAGRTNPRMSRECEQVCRGKGYDCQTRCMREMKKHERDLDLERFSKCQRGCLKKGGGRKCLSICAQDSQIRHEHGAGRNFPLSMLPF